MFKVASPSASLEPMGQVLSPEGSLWPATQIRPLISQGPRRQESQSPVVLPDPEQQTLEGAELSEVESPEPEKGFIRPQAIA